MRKLSFVALTVLLAVPLAGCEGSGWSWKSGLGGENVEQSTRLAPVAFQIRTGNFVFDASDVEISECWLKATGVDGRKWVLAADRTDAFPPGTLTTKPPPKPAEDPPPAAPPEPVKP